LQAGTHFSVIRQIDERPCFLKVVPENCGAATESGVYHLAGPKAKAPARRYHNSGQSVVTIDGKDYYLGKHDSPVQRTNQPITVRHVTAFYREHIKVKFASAKLGMLRPARLCDGMETRDRLGEASNTCRIRKSYRHESQSHTWQC